MASTGDSPLSRFYETHYSRLDGDDASRQQRMTFAVEALSYELPGPRAGFLDVGCGVGKNLLTPE
jgi:hypothetical protein